MTDDFDREANHRQQRATGTYSHTRNWLAHTTDLPEAELDRRALEAVEDGVYGHDAPRNRDGSRREQGIGSKGHETINHFSAMRKYRPKEEYEEAVRELWARDPQHAARLRLPKPEKTA